MTKSQASNSHSIHTATKKYLAHKFSDNTYTGYCVFFTGSKSTALILPVATHFWNSALNVNIQTAI